MTTLDSTNDVTDAGIDLWRVQLPTGEVRAMSLDALDEAFQAGTITETTPVLAPGATAWTRLADAAGLDDGAAAADSASYVPSVAPLAVNVPESSADQRMYGASPSLPDLDLDDDAAFKPKKTKIFVGIGVAVMLVSGLGFAASRMAASVTPGTMSNSLAAQPAAAAQPPPAAEDPNPSAPGRVLTEEQKAKLAEADKARAAAADKKKLDRPPPPSSRPRGPREKSGNTFSNGGDKYDPLNGAL